MVDSLYYNNMYLNNAANRNTWQWDLQTSKPNDILGALNDSSIWSYGANVGSLVNSTAALQAQLPSLIANFQAQMTKMLQNTMSQINNGNVTVNSVVGNTTSTTTTNNNGQKISESKIISYLEKMGSGKAVADRINQEITVDGKKTTILKRLLELVDAYRKDPENSPLSEANFERVWNIVDKYAKNGDITSSEFAILKEIALNPKGETEETEEGDEETDKITRPNEAARTPDAINTIVGDFEKALVGLGTDTDALGYAVDAVNKDNVLEIFDAYKKRIRAHNPNEKQNLVEAILDDCQLWGGGDSDGWDAWYATSAVAPIYNKLFRGKWTAKLGDDAKPRLEIIQEALVARANEFIETHGEEKGITKADIEAFTLPQTEHNAYADEKRNDSAIKTAFSTFITKLKQAEANVYED